MVQKAMTVSTAHLTPSSMKLLAEEAYREVAFLSGAVYEKESKWHVGTDGKHPAYGYFMYMPTEGTLEDWKADFEHYAKKPMPKDLYDLYALAAKEGAAIICIDSDGPEVKELPLYTDMWKEQEAKPTNEALPAVKILTYTVPLFGNRHSDPYGKLVVGEGSAQKVVKFELDGYPWGTITYNRKPYSIRNYGGLYSPDIRIVPAEE